MARNCGRNMNGWDRERLLRDGCTPEFVGAAFRCSFLIGLAAALLLVWTRLNRRKACR